MSKSAIGPKCRSKVNKCTQKYTHSHQLARLSLWNVDLANISSEKSSPKFTHFICFNQIPAKKTRHSAPVCCWPIHQCPRKLSTVRLQPSSIPMNFWPKPTQAFEYRYVVVVSHYQKGSFKEKIVFFYTFFFCEAAKFTGDATSRQRHSDVR